MRVVAGGWAATGQGRLRFFCAFLLQASGAGREVEASTRRAEPLGIPAMDESYPGMTRAMPARSGFDEDAYLQTHPDVAAAVAAGQVGSGWQHFLLHGFAEGRLWVPKTDALEGVERRIAPGDEMNRGDVDHYFDVGESALHCIEAALFTARRHRSGIRRILDLPCGHGRVMRFLRKAFPEAELTACDLNRDGVDFCAASFRAIPVASCAEVAAIPVQGRFDLIWCGSLLTHLPQLRCADFLRLFHDRLEPGGILVFTLHGRCCEPELAANGNRFDLDAGQVAELLTSYRGTGFGYVDYAGQPGYGFSLAAPEYVLAHFLRQPQWQLIGYHENGWDKRQDVISVCRPAR
jgi:SAM-dependent methyltransferase